jgi:3-dehydroquinate synthetase
LETTAGYGQFLHGEAVAVGLAVAADLSMSKSTLPAVDRDLILAKLVQFQLPVHVPGNIATSALLEALKRDKKFRAGAIRFVLLRAIGDAYLADDVTEDEIAAAIDKRR